MSADNYHKDRIANRKLHPETLMMGFGYSPAMSEGALKPPIQTPCGEGESIILTSPLRTFGSSSVECWWFSALAPSLSNGPAG